MKKRKLTPKEARELSALLEILECAKLASALASAEIEAFHKRTFGEEPEEGGELIQMFPPPMVILD